MSDSTYLRCRTCCTAATGDPTRVDRAAFEPFIGGLEPNWNAVKYYEAELALKLARPIQAAAQAILVLQDAGLEAHRNAQLEGALTFSAFAGSTTIDLRWFAEHGHHDLVIYEHQDLGVCCTCWYQASLIRPKHPEHAR